MNTTIGGQATDIAVNGHSTGLDCQCAVVFAAGKIRKIELCPLHAAAPELLAALERISNAEVRADRRRSGMVDVEEVTRLQRIAHTAIAKARGES